MGGKGRMSRIIDNETDSSNWNRVYSDGWIEQGGKITTSFSSRGSYSFTFPNSFERTE